MILVNGDSYTFGDGLNSRETPWPALMFGNQCKNIAESGSSNSSIFRRSLEEIYQNPYTMLVVAWSALYRLEWADNNGKAKTFLLQNKTNNPSADKIIKELVTNWHNEFWYFKQFLITVNNLKLHCQQLGIEFYCLHTSLDMPLLYSTKYSDYLTFWGMFNLDYYTDQEIQREFNFLTKLMEETADCWIVPPTESIEKFYGSNIISPSNYHPNQAGHQLIANGLTQIFKLKTYK
jgi:hypothetical protein